MGTMRDLAPRDTAYHTSTLYTLQPQLQKTISTLEKLTIMSADGAGPIKKIREDEERKLLAVQDNSVDIPVFLHPLHVDGVTYVDFRPYINREGAIKNKVDSLMLAERAMFEMEWMSGREGFQVHADYIIDVYSDWFSTGLGRRLDMDLKATTWLRIYAAIFAYGLLFKPVLRDERDIEDEKGKIMKIVSRATRIPAIAIEQAMDHADEIKADWAVMVNNDPGLPPALQRHYRALQYILTTSEVFGDIEFKPVLIATSLAGGSFLGANSKEVALAGIESMPTFIYMMYKSSQKGIYGKTKIGISTLGMGRRHNMAAFIKYCDSIVSA